MLAERGASAANAATRRCPACLSTIEMAGEPLRMRTCASCRTVSAWPLPSPDELARYYNSDYAVVAGGLTSRSRTNWTALFEEAERRAEGRRGLEFGSSNGPFLRLGAERDWHIVGVELDERARRQHRRQSPNIPVWGSLAEAASAGIRSLDVAWALHTIEHLREPEVELGQIRSLLAPGGLLVLTTPNGGCLERRLLGALWEWWTPPAHLFLATPDGVRSLLERAGFDVLRIATRRGDSAGLAANTLLLPARLLRRRLGRNGRQRSYVRSPAQRAAALVNLLYDPVSKPIRSMFYRRGLLGPELVVVARRPGPAAY